MGFFIICTNAEFWATIFLGTPYDVSRNHGWGKVDLRIHELEYMFGTSCTFSTVHLTADWAPGTAPLCSCFHRQRKEAVVCASYTFSLQDPFQWQEQHSRFLFPSLTNPRLKTLLHRSIRFDKSNWYSESYMLKLLTFNL